MYKVCNVLIYIACTIVGTKDAYIVGNGGFMKCFVFDLVCAVLMALLLSIPFDLYFYQMVP